ncbi:hypothetical protein JYB62_02675 [Algoriphagus lutimaris]|uniref:hypothetical protein n=1 Tax=Algoriphagus lutimaris TaxID=613197 RepID=UPI00196B4189|nr:hypothetical protein [Algoriphagus lutimaris]MBN3518894.1 hypothetical protein [Algoriphagus lutimaris]
MKILGIVLILAGAFMFFSNSISFTTKEKVVDAGPIQINAEKQHKVDWPSYAGGIVAATGVVLLIFSKKK